MTAVQAQPTAADFLARNRGGGLFTMTVSQRLGAYLSVVAHRLGLAPTILTIGNLVIGLGASIAVLTLVPRDHKLHVVVGLAALVLWQLAYALDCADGQLARVTGRTSPAGKRIDILCDVAIQIALVAAVVAVASSYTHLPSWLGALFAGTWMVNLVTSVMQSGPQAASMIESRSLPVRVVKLVRDYGAVIALAGLVLTVAPQWTIWLVSVFTLINAGFLAASIAFAGRQALRS
jgi:phosphatidylglycerophosphate synthase